jgi:acyl-phosphate glycerol 3-phosphate acyltransferase
MAEEFILLILIGYLIGSIPASYLSMRLFTGRDLRKLGTGNATLTAVFLHGGRRPGIVAFIGEVAKAGVCFLTAYFMVGETWASMVILVAAVYGCSWSIWLKGGGGQGLTVGVFGLVLVNVLPVLIMAAFYILPEVITRRHVLSNRLFRLSLPVILWLWYDSWEFALAGCLIVLPSFIKQFITGDDVVEARKARSVG